MHKKRPRHSDSTVAMVLLMNAGSAKIRDGAVGTLFAPLFRATTWIVAETGNKESSRTSKISLRLDKSRFSMESLRQDFVYGLRLFSRSPVFASIFVISLAAGIGAATWSFDRYRSHIQS